jgi:hypothetical protein
MSGRLEAYPNEVTGLPSKRSCSDEMLLAEGLRWHQLEPRFDRQAIQIAPPNLPGRGQCVR